MRMFIRLVVLFFLLSRGAFCATMDPAWQVAPATIRLFTEPLFMDGKSVWVDFPPSLQASFHAVQARTATGEALPFIPLYVNDRLMGGELSFPESFRRQWVTERKAKKPQATAAQLYLLPDPGKNTAPTAAFTRNPVNLRVRVEACIARPISAAEYQQLSRNRRLLPWFRALPSFPDSDFLTELAKVFPIAEKKQSQHVWRYQLSAFLRIEKQGRYQFAVPGKRNGAWFLSIDGESILGWCEGDVWKKWRRSPEICLDPGVHSLVFSGMIRATETFPQLCMASGNRADSSSTTFVPLTTDQLFSSTPVRTLAIQRRDGILNAGLQFSPLARYFFSETASELSVYRVRNISWNLFRHPLRTSSLSLDNSLLMSGKRKTNVFFPAALLHDFTYKAEDAAGFQVTSVFRFREGVIQKRKVQVTLSLDTVPLFTPRNLQQTPQPLVLDYQLTIKPKTALLPGRQARLEYRILDENRKVIRQTLLPISPFPLQRKIHFGRLPEKGKVMEATILIAGYPVSAPVRVYWLDGTESPRLFKPSPVSLRFADGQAMIRRLTLANIPRKPPITTAGRKIWIFDDLTGGNTEGHSGRSIAENLEKQTGLPCSRIRLDPASLRGEAPVLAKFTRLPAAFPNHQAAGIVWLIGSNELAAKMPLADFIEQWLYLIRLCEQNGKYPVLTTIPAFAPFPPAVLRSYALAVKELAAYAGLPVLDLYSVSLLSQKTGGFYRSSNPAVSGSGLNNKGREWLTQQISAMLKQQIPTLGHGKEIASTP